MLKYIFFNILNIQNTEKNKVSSIISKTINI